MHQRERRITSLIDSHIKLSALYPHCGTRKFPKSSEIKIASPEVWDPTKKTVTPTTTIRSKIAHFPRRRGCRETISGETPMGPCAPLACSKAALITVRYVSYMPDWKKRSTRSKGRKQTCSSSSVCRSQLRRMRQNITRNPVFSTMAVFD